MPGQMVTTDPSELAGTTPNTKYSIQNTGSRGQGLLYAMYSASVPTISQRGWHIIPYPRSAVMSHDTDEKLYVRCDPGMYGLDQDTFEIAFSEAT